MNLVARHVVAWIDCYARQLVVLSGAIGVANVAYGSAVFFALPLTAVGLLVGGVLGSVVGMRLISEWRARADNDPTAPPPTRCPRPRGEPAVYGPAVQIPPFASARWKVLLVLGALVVASTAYSRVDAVLHAFHRPGDASFGANALTGLFSNPLQVSLKVGEAVQTWKLDYAARQRDAAAGVQLRDPRQLLAAQFAIDSLMLVPSYVFLLAVLVGASRRLLQRERYQIVITTSAGLLKTFFGLHRWAAAGVLLAAVGDWLENGLAVTVVNSAWSAPQATVTGAASVPICVGSCQLLAILLGASTWAKLIGILIALAYVASVGVLALQHGGDGDRTWFRLPGLRHTLFRLALPAGIIAALGLLLLANPQAPDVLRRWTRPGDEAGVIFSGLAGTLVLAAAVALSAWWLFLEPNLVANPEPVRGKPGSLQAQLTPTGWWFAGTAVLLYSAGGLPPGSLSRCIR